MNCENSSILVKEARCPSCRSRKLREPKPDDPCFLTEQNYISSGILEDVLKQNEIPCLIRNVLGAGIAFRIGPMLDRSRFYVPYKNLEQAQLLVEDLFSPKAEE